jgi:hypothetical protein
MASPTRRLKVRRRLAQTGAGKTRKNRVRREGSTAPNLKLNVPNANEKAQAKQA